MSYMGLTKKEDKFHYIYNAVQDIIILIKLIMVLKFMSCMDLPKMEDKYRYKYNGISDIIRLIIQIILNLISYMGQPRREDKYCYKYNEIQDIIRQYYFISKKFLVSTNHHSKPRLINCYINFYYKNFILTNKSNYMVGL